MINECQLCGAPGGYPYCNRDCEEADNPTDVEAIRYTADVVAVTDDDHVLLIERGWDPYAGHWALPGGHVDPGETSRAAAARELEEETGVRVDADNLTSIGVFDAPDRDPRGRYVSAAYLARVPAATHAAAGDDARNAEWVPLDTLPPLAFDHDTILQAALDTTSPRAELTEVRADAQAKIQEAARFAHNARDERDRLRAELAARPTRAALYREVADEGARWATDGVEALALSQFGHHLRASADAAERDDSPPAGNG